MSSAPVPGLQPAVERPAFAFCESERSVLAQLLHALNQPLTGLQCSPEVALAMPRTPERYVETLRQALELTARLRALAGAIREVLPGTETAPAPEQFDAALCLREIALELAPVAETNRVPIALHCGAVALFVKARRKALSGAIFRTLESALTLAEAGSELRVAAAQAPGRARQVQIEIQWRDRKSAEPPFLAELGLLVAQAAWERCDCGWFRSREAELQTITISPPSADS